MSENDVFELLVDSDLFVNARNMDNLLEHSVLDFRFPESILIDSELCEKLEISLSILETKEREIVKMRFGFDDGVEHTLKETGSKFNISQQTVMQVINRSISKLLKNSNTSAILVSLL